MKNNIDCCCDCIHLKTIYRHPTNQWVGKGQVTEIFGYGCVGLGDVIFFESDNTLSSCELHQTTPKSC